MTRHLLALTATTLAFAALLYIGAVIGGCPW